MAFQLWLALASTLTQASPLAPQDLLALASHGLACSVWVVSQVWLAFLALAGLLAVANLLTMAGLCDTQLLSVSKPLLKNV